MKILHSLSLGAAFAAVLAVQAQPSTPTIMQQTRHAFETSITRSVRLEYLLHLPSGYSTSGAKRWPLMLFLHGAGERGTNVALVAVHGPPKIVENKPDFPFILVSPQCPAGQAWSDEAVLALLDDVAARHRVDAKRIYLTGLSMGGYGTWSLAVHHPERFAAIAPICGGGETIDVLLADRKRKEALGKLAIWAFHGGKDSVVPLSESQRMVDALKRAGCKGVELTVYPEAGHDSWTETYNNPGLFDWFLKHSLD